MEGSRPLILSLWQVLFYNSVCNIGHSDMTGVKWGLFKHVGRKHEVPSRNGTFFESYNSDRPREIKAYGGGH